MDLRLDAAGAPSFVWSIPQGQNLNWATSRLLDGFMVAVFNADYSALVLQSAVLTLSNGLTLLNAPVDGDGLPSGPRQVAWQPSDDQWNDLLANTGVYHFVVIGSGVRGYSWLSGVYTESYFTGAYWSGAYDFEVF